MRYAVQVTWTDKTFARSMTNSYHEERDERQPKLPRVIFYDGFGELDALDIRDKGWATAHVELENGTRYTLNFYDPVRLGQELEDDLKLGRPCLVELNLMVVPEVTVEAIQRSAQFLWQIGFFDDLKPEPQVAD